MRGESQDGVSRGERKNGMMVGENFQTQCCQVASHSLGLPVGRFLVSFYVGIFRNFCGTELLYVILAAV
jgi:hypothetical protein